MSIFLLNMQAYPKEAKISEYKGIRSFLSSECEMIILIYDVSFVDIYAKDKNFLMQFIENAEKCGCIEIIIKTD